MKPNKEMDDIELENNDKIAYTAESFQSDMIEWLTTKKMEKKYQYDWLDYPLTREYSKTFPLVKPKEKFEEMSKWDFELWWINEDYSSLSMYVIEDIATTKDWKFVRKYTYNNSNDDWPDWESVEREDVDWYIFWEEMLEWFKLYNKMIKKDEYEFDKPKREEKEKHLLEHRRKQYEKLKKEFE